MTDSSTRSSLDGPVGVVTIHRPEKLNALNAAVLDDASAAFTELAGDGETRVAILTGAGEKAFVAGADIAAMAEMNAGEAEAFARQGHSLGERMIEAPFPIIAAVNGFALGGGCELALACDLIYASDKARFGLPEVTLGVIPGFGGTQRLARRVGVGKAREMVFTGVAIDAAEALSIGLADRVFPHDKLRDEAVAAAERIAGQRAPRRGLRQACDARGRERAPGRRQGARDRRPSGCASPRRIRRPGCARSSRTRRAAGTFTGR